MPAMQKHAACPTHPRRRAPWVAAIAALAVGCTPEASNLEIGAGEFEMSFMEEEDREHEAFHKLISIEGTVPEDIAAVADRTLVLRLWDASRPDQTCDVDHPFSGCVSIDYSDATGLPHVPEGGVFDNRLTLAFLGGDRDLHLNELSELSDEPDEYSPS
jgi:hypothetical protein